MKRFKWLSLLSILVLLITLTGCGQQSATQKKTLTVATSGTLYPTSYHDSKTKKLTGYDIEVVRAIARQMHKRVVFKEYSVDGMLTAVKTGKADIAVDDFSISPARQKHFLMSSPIKHSFDSILVRASDDSGIHNWHDLKGKKSAGEAGTNYQRLAKQLGSQNVNYDNVSNDVYFRDVKNGKTDYIMNDYYMQKLALKAYPHSGLKIMSGMYFTTNEDGTGEGIVINKHDQALQKKVNQAITKLKHDGQLGKIAKKYYGTDVTKVVHIKNLKHFNIKNQND